MNRYPRFGCILALSVLGLAVPGEAKQPATKHVQIANDAGVAQRMDVSAEVGERLLIVSSNRDAEIEVAVKRLPPHKRAIVYVELQPRQGTKMGTVPMGLPLDRWFRLVNVNSGHGVAVKDQSVNAGARLVQENVNAADRGLLWRLIPVAQGWYALQNRSTEQVASLPDNRKNAGANLVQVALDGDSIDQQWRPLWLGGNRFVVVNRRSGQALAVAYGATHRGATICQWPLNLDWGQHQWRIEVVDSE
jgi:hypothetical protein